MQKRYIPLTVFFVALLLFLAHLGARVHLAEPAFTFAESGEKKTVYLTFDDGPSTVVTGKILDTLQRESVKATFFIVSERAETRKDTLRRIVAEGHTLGIHSTSHVYSKIYASDKSFLDDVTTCRRLIIDTTGVTPAVYRFPGGELGYSEQRISLLKDLGLQVVQWNAVCGDAEIHDPDAAALYRRTVETSKGKRHVVLLCHDSASCTATAEALPQIIAYFRQAGYTFCAF